MADIKAYEDEMVSIPKGKVLLRDDRIKEEWQVEIAPFLLAKYPVTQDIYKELTGQTPSAFTGDKRPVESVTWHEAVVFCNQLSVQSGLKECYIIDNESEVVKFNKEVNGYRLPTEAEWEYACKAGTTEIRYGELDDIAWYKGNSEQQTHNVGAKSPNNWGLYDMLGNVWEWCSDIYDEEVYGSYRIFRGGGWCDEARGCIATNRRRSHPIKFKIDDLGFRLARTV